MEIVNQTFNGTVDIEFIGWNFKAISHYIIVAIFLLFLIIVKMMHSNIYIINKVIPESLLLLISGSLFGVFIRYGCKTHFNLDLTPNMFFFVLLPPIILDASYGLATRSFGSVVPIVLTLATVGTILSFVLIGCSYELGRYWNLLGEFNGKLWLFSSIIVAIDPVAVLAIFSDIGVKPELYFVVFGESLINDGVTVVLYQLVLHLISVRSPGIADYLCGVGSFLTVSLGGGLIGLIVGVVACFLTKFQTQYDVVLLIILGYLSYLGADLMKWSGIISIMVCGLIQACYCFHNITSQSLLILRKLISIWCSLSEGVIFLFLGERLAYLNVGWDTVFVVWTTLACIVSRFVVIFSIVGVFNFFSKSDKILNFRDQFVLSYSGLRGAVAFSLIVLIPKHVISNETHDVFVSTILFVILFSVAIQGLSMKQIIKLFNLKEQDFGKMSLFFTVNEFMIDHSLAAVEIICGHSGSNTFREWWTNFNNRYIKPILQKHPVNRNEKLLTVMKRISLAIHFDLMQPIYNANLKKHKDDSDHVSDKDKFVTRPMNCQRVSIMRSRFCPESVSNRSDENLNKVLVSGLETSREKGIIVKRSMSTNPVVLIKEVNRVNLIRKASMINERIRNDQETEISDEELTTLIYESAL